uniref:Uncharacterized protein n=2 Tax=Oryza sativa subsp. japonica TaxID=39947 RepID=Q53JW7_ORYSJ|nr:hypothetical protein LOC_Os11g22890 [Oryza sativa Japonica Group]ABA93076.1 hypothetical protein LOC_Os11g22890 [Oryza sativa Japonica Group]
MTSAKGGGGGGAGMRAAHVIGSDVPVHGGLSRRDRGWEYHAALTWHRRAGHAGGGWTAPIYPHVVRTAEAARGMQRCGSSSGGASGGARRQLTMVTGGNATATRLGGGARRQLTMVTGGNATATRLGGGARRWHRTQRERERERKEGGRTDNDERRQVADNGGDGVARRRL